MSWSLLPEPLLYTVFSLLPTKQVVVAGQVCRRWGGVAGDSLLWRRLLARDYRLQVSRLGGPGRFKSAMMVGDPDLGAEFLSDKILVLIHFKAIK